MAILLGLLLLVPAALSEPSPCCGPDKWSASVVDTIGEYNRDLDHASLGYATSDLFYDWEGKQLAYRQKLSNETMGVIENSWVIMKYKESATFTIKDKQCTKTELKGMMDKPCMLEDATFFGTHTYPAGVIVDVWFMQDKMSGGSMRIGVTTDKCMRATMSHLSGGPDYTLTMSLYTNVTATITDPSVFDVPSYCTKTQLKKGLVSYGNVIIMDQDVKY